jgi:hypothetical protein
MSNDFAAKWASLHFEQRQASWDGSMLRVFRQLHGRQDRPNVWECWVQGDRYFTHHGLLDGKMQDTSKQGKWKNRGKANEISPEQDALAEARRLCRKKWDFEGYDEFVGDTNVDNRAAKSIPHMLTNLPGSFCLYKPKNNILECKGLLEKLANGETSYTLKRNGLAHWIVKDHMGNITIYSRRNRLSHKDEGPRELPDGTMDHSHIIPWATRYPHIVSAVQAMKLPNNTMLAVELVHPEGDTKRHFAHVQSVSKSLTPQALEDQKQKGWLVAYVWDIPFWDSRDCVSTLQVGLRHKRLRDRIEELPKWAKEWILPVKAVTFPSLDASLEYARDNGLEGWVVIEGKGVYGDRAWTLKGKPDRPSNCAKAKPWYEDDFVVFWDPAQKIGSYGKGRHEANKTVTLPSGESAVHGGVGSVGLHQYDSHGKLVYISDCSGGMDYEFQTKLRPEHFPMVWEVQYTERSYQSEGDDTNALTFAKLFRVRTDKTPEECINDKL